LHPKNKTTHLQHLTDYSTQIDKFVNIWHQLHCVAKGTAGGIWQVINNAFSLLRRLVQVQYILHNIIY